MTQDLPLCQWEKGLPVSSNGVQPLVYDIPVPSKTRSKASPRLPMQPFL